ncbi:ATP-dependent zinc metalloprotease FtsH [Candidatus Peregrinibacteria bacterium]|nr:ATP-dependent zinc metalloprotease FtsH [Candidatus Peregrinibacteria bacterium]
MQNHLPPPKFEPPQRNKSFLYVILFALLLTAAYYLVNPQPPNGETAAKEMPISQLTADYASGKLEAIEIKGNKLYATTLDGQKYMAYKADGDTIGTLGLTDPKNSTAVAIISTEASAFWLSLLSNWLPIILFIALIVFMAKQLGKGASSAFSFGKSQARVYSKNGKNRTTFKEVAGMEEAKDELVEVVDFLKNPKKYTRIGAKIPRGVLLIGSPGTGKTLLARAVAGEANVPFFSISGSEFVEMFVGVGASRVRDLFQKAKRNAPCIIFIDEIDAVGRQRGFGMGGGHDEREQTLNQILTEMDGFEQGTNVIVLAATNRPDILDYALMRPGRFDRRVTIDMPNLKEREEILKVHVRGKQVEKQVKLEPIAQQTPGFSGADLENLVNEAAILAAKNNRHAIAQEDLEKSIEKVGLGPEKKSRRLTNEEKKITAYHEVGHALIGKLLPHCDPVHKVSIISRGMALGVTWFVPEEDKHLKSVSKFKDELCSLLGGYMAEKQTFGEVTTGASSDLMRATEIARRMVTEYGMSEELGPVIFGEKSSGQFLGADFGMRPNYSEEVAAKIDGAVANLINEAKEKTAVLLEENKALLKKIADVLLKKEVLNKEEFDKFFPKKKKILVTSSHEDTLHP